MLYTILRVETGLLLPKSSVTMFYTNLAEAQAKIPALNAAYYNTGNGWVQYTHLVKSVEYTLTDI